MKTKILIFSFICGFLIPAFAEVTSTDSNESAQQSISNSDTDGSFKTAQYVSITCRTILPKSPCVVSPLSVNSPCFCPYKIDKDGKFVKFYTPFEMEKISDEENKLVKYVQGIITFN